ncbi:hypothetical protein [Chondromyces crocatus]|uniref:Uncharacterized protein n=1 Tax=Chondromyces crocatus TaxID=52 RepID=A0A0K1E9I2_CHOCO|nr:hypothetical protein [Chondromyces crocatus]AKT37337.1 uncharacterized protein CMC5_014700 [Chondromyces crocatus]
MFFGMYRMKSVRQVAVIEAVIDVGEDSPAKILWRNVGTPDAELVSLAIDERNRLRPGSPPHRFFLLGQLHETNFMKTTKGGMRPPKQYFDVEKLAPIDAADLAEKLRGKSWSNY